MVDILLNSMYLAELKRTAPLMPEHLSYESTSKHIATPEKQVSQFISSIQGKTPDLSLLIYLTAIATAP